LVVLTLFDVNDNAPEMPSMSEFAPTVDENSNEVDIMNFLGKYVLDPL
jgi:hypothetical protein